MALDLPPRPRHDETVSKPGRRRGGATHPPHRPIAPTATPPFPWREGRSRVCGPAGTGPGSRQASVSNSLKHTPNSVPAPLVSHH